MALARKRREERSHRAKPPQVARIPPLTSQWPFDRVVKPATIRPRRVVGPAHRYTRGLEIDIRGSGSFRDPATAEDGDRCQQGPAKGGESGSEGRHGHGQQENDRNRVST